MRDREAEFESLGAEGIPVGFADIDRVMRTSVEHTRIDQHPRHRFEPIGLIAIAARWIDRGHTIRGAGR